MSRRFMVQTPELLADQSIPAASLTINDDC
jgi:hypothetical protein